MRRVLLSVLAAVSWVLHASALPELDAAREVARLKRYPEARAALEKIVEKDPRNAAACYELGRIIRRQGDAPGYEEAVKWFVRAAELDPKNAVYHSTTGATWLQLAGKTNSVSAAMKGRDALERAVQTDPGLHEAREGLIQFYQRAPWPVGSGSKANAHYEELRKREPDRAFALRVAEKLNAKEYDAAFALCDDALAKNSQSYLALFHYGRTASASGRNLERGLERYQACLALTPSPPGAPSHSQVWHRIGQLQERLQRPAEARAAYEAAVQLEPANQQAANALARLK